MENERNNMDEKWDGLLRELGRRETLEPAPSQEQAARWMRSIAANRESTPSHAHIHWRKWFTYAASAAVLVLAVTLSLFVERNELTAEEVFVNVDHSITASPVVSFSLSNIKAQNHLINMDFMGSNTDGAVYVTLNIRPDSADMENSVYADIAYMSKDSKGFLLIRSITCGGKDILADMAPKGNGLVLRFDGISSDSAKSRFLPEKVQVSSIRDLIDSLKNSASNFQISKIDGNRSEIFGVIDKPQNISINALMQSAMIANYSNMLVMGICSDASNATLTPEAKENYDAVGKVLMGSQFGSLLKILPSQVDRVFRFLAACQVYRSSDMERSPEYKKYRKELDKALNAMSLAIIYDRKTKLIQRVTLKDSDNVSVNIRLTSDAELTLKINEVTAHSKKADDLINLNLTTDK